MAPTLSSICEDEVFVADLPPPPWSCRPAPEGLDTNESVDKNPFAGTLDDNDIDFEMEYAGMLFESAVPTDQLQQVEEAAAVGPVC